MSSAIALATTATLAYLVAMPVPAAADDAKTLVNQTAGAIIDVLGSTDLPSDQKRSRIEKIVYDAVDFETVSRLVLARNWRRLSPTQQVEFIEEFKQHLSRTYGENVDNYGNERIEIVGDREEPRGDWTVQTRILRQAGDLHADYRLRKRDGAWKIIDISIEGVSLVANFRSQFQGILANGGPDRLLKALREKNVKKAPLESS